MNKHKIALERKKILDKAEKLKKKGIKYKLKTDIYYLKLFAKQIQNHYNYIRLHRQLKFNNRLFSPMEYFYLKKMDKSL